MVLCDAEFAATVDRGCPLVLGGPLPHVIAAKAVALHEASQPEFETYAQRIVENAAALAEGLQSRDVAVVTGGSENHLVLVDVRPFGLTGRQAEGALRSAGVTLNRNVIPYDTNGSGTPAASHRHPAVTTLGMGTAEMREIAPIIASVLRATAPTKTASGKTSLANYTLDEATRAQAEGRARDLLGRFPLYPEIEL
jgi:glycine hydroxymethyltransferase